MVRLQAKLAVFLVVALVIPATSARLAWFDRSATPSKTNDDESQLSVRLLLLSEQDKAYCGQQTLDLSHASPSKNYTPVVFWHGMGDTAYGSINIDRLALEKRYPGIQVFSIQIGKTFVEDELAGYFVNVNRQIELACQAILDNDQIRASGAMNAVGFSQGAQFIRALVQRCPLREHGIRVKNLVSLGGQHQGVFGLPNCYTTVWCDYIRHMLSTAAYEPQVQEHLVQAEYWHDPLHESDYKAKNIFLPDVNNENTINETYRRNLLALDNFVLVQFAQDDMVVPRESSLFAFYEPGQNAVIRPLEKSALWLEDRLGLRRLHDTNRLKMLTVPGRHLRYKMSWFLNEIAAKYLNN
jgi:palmitoyl-protein thioesterase